MASKLVKKIKHVLNELGENKMYSIDEGGNQIPEVGGKSSAQEYQDFENFIVDTELRISQFKKKEGENVLYLYDNNLTLHSSFRYRAYNMLEVINSHKDYNAICLFLDEEEAIESILVDLDILILVRLPWSFRLQKLITKAKGLGIKIVYEVDDLVFDVDRIPEVINHVGAKEEQSDYWISYVSSRYLVAKQSDAFITTNDFLANKLRKAFNQKVFIIRNFLNFGQIDAGNRIKDLRLENQKGDEFVLGYFSGSNTHDRDFELIRNQLVNLLEKFDNLKLKVVGYLNTDDSLEVFVNAGRIEIVQFVDYIEMLELFAMCDLNLVPLVKSDFTDCKSELKYFEAGLVGTVSLMSPSYIYKAVIRDEENGFLVKDDEWEQKISKLIDNNTLEAVRKNAGEDILKNYQGELVSSQINQVLGKISNLT